MILDAAAFSISSKQRQPNQQNDHTVYPPVNFSRSDYSKFISLLVDFNRNSISQLADLSSLAHIAQYYSVSATPDGFQPRAYRLCAVIFFAQTLIGQRFGDRVSL